MAIYNNAVKKRSLNISTTGVTGQQILLVGYDTLEADLASAGIFIGAPFPGKPLVLCRNINAQNYGKNTPTGYEFYRITADYSTGEAAQRQEIGHIEERIEFSWEEFEKPGGTWEADESELSGSVLFDSEGNPIDPNAGTVVRADETPILAIPKEVYSFTLIVGDMIAYRNKIRRIAGCVNSDAWKGCKPGSLRFEGGSSEKFWNEQVKAYCWRVNMNIAYSGDEHTWQERWNAANKKWKKMKFGEDFLYKEVSYAGIDVAT